MCVSSVCVCVCVLGCLCLISMWYVTPSVLSSIHRKRRLGAEALGVFFVSLVEKCGHSKAHGLMQYKTLTASGFPRNLRLLLRLTFLAIRYVAPIEIIVFPKPSRIEDCSISGFRPKIVFFFTKIRVELWKLVTKS